MKKFLLSFLALAIAVFTFTPVHAGDYTVETLPAPASPTLSYVIPLVAPASSGSGFSSTTVTSSVTQQVFLASELTSLGASAGNIRGVKFYYGGKGNNTTVASVTRSIKIYITQITEDSLKLDTLGSELKRYRFSFKDPGALVYEGTITTEEITSKQVKELPIGFNQGILSWDGMKNILLTVFDVTNESYTSEQQNFRFVLKSTTTPRYVHQYWVSGGDKKASDYLSTLAGLEGCTYYSGSGTSQKTQITGHCFVPKTTFTIVPSIPQPTSPSATSISSSSATINWVAAAGADSYEIRYGTTSGSLGAATNIGNVTSYTLTGLEDETTYYYQVRTKIGSDYSAWTDESSFTTLAASPFVYKGITFSKWNTATSMPTSGNYYLNTDVELSANASLTGDLNLCLNGHNLLTYAYKITVSGHTFALYDNEGTGVIRGAHQTAYSGLIYVEADGVFAIGEGSVQNIAEENSVAIYNLGLLKLSGAPTISGVTAGIQLASSKYITIESGKPLTNTTPYSVNSAAQTITFGWSNMGGANPSDYFTSAKSGYAGVCLNGSGEAQLVRVMSLDQEEDNASAISSSTYAGQLINVSLTRSLTSTQYNTFCLPFALDDDQLQEFFGSGYDLQELTGSSLDGETLNLEFTKRNALEAGKPYLLQPSFNVTNPVFEGVTITATSPGTSTTDCVDYKAVYSPTELAGGNRNLLFLGAGNELFWPESTGNLNGFRAYFEIKDAAAQAAKRARISMGGKIATGNLSPTLPQGEGVKILRDGKLYLIYKGQMYDVQGRRI